MSIFEKVILLKLNLAETKTEKIELEKKVKKALEKSNELTSSLKTLEKKHDKARKSALICSLLTAFSLSFIPLIGVFFAIVPVSLIITVIVQSVRMFKTEGEIDKTKNASQTCNKLLTAYKEDLDLLERKVKNLFNEVENLVAYEAKSSLNSQAFKLQKEKTEDSTFTI